MENRRVSGRGSGLCYGEVCFSMVKGEKLVREGDYSTTGGSRFSCSNQKIAPPMPKSVSGKPIMLTGDAVYNEGADGV